MGDDHGSDDAINIYTPPNVVREIRSPTQWLVSPGALILPGDRTGLAEAQPVRGLVIEHNQFLDRAGNQA